MIALFVILLAVCLVFLTVVLMRDYNAKKKTKPPAKRR